MATIHITEAEAARDFAALMEQVLGGNQVIIETGGQRVVIETRPKVFTLKDLVALQERHRDAFDDEFARDVEEARENFNRPLDASAWD
jgi:hypothetical protein